MQRIHLIRHGRPDFPGLGRMCLGHTDLPLDMLGRLQAVLTASLPELSELPLFSSPLLRAVQTAEAFSQPFQILPGTEELYAGDWDGLSFDEIRIRFPDLYAARGLDRSIPIPGAETPSQGKQRFLNVLQRVLESTASDFIIITHNGIIQALLERFDMVPYGSITTFIYDQGHLYPEQIGVLPHPSITNSICENMMQAIHTPTHIIEHCRKTMETAVRLSEGLPLDRASIQHGALLHDMVRQMADHASYGARLLTALGYPDLADIVARHHDHDGQTLDEASIVFLADKLVQGCQNVTLEQRFSLSVQKCVTLEQKAAHQKRRLAAERIFNLISHEKRRMHDA